MNPPEDINSAIKRGKSREGVLEKHGDAAAARRNRRVAERWRSVIARFCVDEF